MLINANGQLSAVRQMLKTAKSITKRSGMTEQEKLAKYARVEGLTADHDEVATVLNYVEEMLMARLTRKAV